jgi:hypothetical protein
MDYNIQYIDTQYALINTFLIGLSDNVLDISYSINGRKLTIQVVLLEGSDLSEELKKRVELGLSDFEVVLDEIHISKEKFNQHPGEWAPVYYEWLDYLLFSKAEAL